VPPRSVARRRWVKQGVIVLDAPALLALLDREPGWEVVVRAAAAEDATTSAVNYAEVLQKSARVGISSE